MGGNVFNKRPETNLNIKGAHSLCIEARASDSPEKHDFYYPAVILGVPSWNIFFVRRNVNPNVLLADQEPLFVDVNNLIEVEDILIANWVEMQNAIMHTLQFCSSVNNGLRAKVVGIITVSNLSSFILNSVDFDIPTATAKLRSDYL